MDRMELIISFPETACHHFETRLPLSETLPDVCNSVTSATVKVLEMYRWIMSFGDTRLAGWPLISDMFSALCIVNAYIFISILGPKVMANFKPFDLRWFIVIYNIILSFSNIYFVIQTIILAWRLDYSYGCRPVRFDVPLDDHPLEIELTKVFYFAFISRTAEFMESFIYVLRKKEKQLTILHVYHHATVFTFCWMIMHFGPQGPAFQLIVTNCTVHFVMYLYYGLAALGPKYRKYLWWKIYLTRVQIFQFVHCLAVCIIYTFVECPVPDWIRITAAIYMISLIILFGNFYYHAYIEKDKKAKRIRCEDSKDEDLPGYAIRDHINGCIS